MTWNDPELSFYVKFCFRSGTSRFFCVDLENNKGKPAMSAAGVHATLVPDKLRFMRIFAGFCGEEASNSTWWSKTATVSVLSVAIYVRKL